MSVSSDLTFGGFDGDHASLDGPADGFLALAPIFDPWSFLLWWIFLHQVGSDVSAGGIDSWPGCTSTRMVRDGGSFDLLVNSPSLRLDHDSDPRLHLTVRVNVIDALLMNLNTINFCNDYEKCMFDALTLYRCNHLVFLSAAIISYQIKPYIIQ